MLDIYFMSYPMKYRRTAWQNKESEYQRPQVKTNCPKKIKKPLSEKSSTSTKHQSPSTDKEWHTMATGMSTRKHQPPEGSNST